MSYGLPPTTGTTASSSTSTSATTQPPGYRASGSGRDATEKSQSSSCTNVSTFIPRGPQAQRGHQYPDRSLNIRDRQAKASQNPSLQTFHQSDNATQPKTAKRAKINDAFKELSKQKFSNAEEAFRTILKEGKNKLSDHERKNLTIGLARSLKEQTHEKQKEACSLLKELRLKGKFSAFGASTIPNLDLTLSLCEQALRHYPDAEARLTALRNIKPDADEETLCEPSGNFDADIANTRLWQFMKKNTLAETLLLKMEKQLTSELKWRQSAVTCTVTIERLHKYLHIVKIALARLWQWESKYEKAEDLLLNMSGKHPGASEKVLCKPCEDHDVNLTLAIVWQDMGKYQLIEKLLLNMSGKPLNASEDILCKPCSQHDINMALAVHWVIAGKNHLAEKLLLNMSNKPLNASDNILCRPTGQLDVDLTQARIWEVTGKHHLTERLLLNMSGKDPKASEYLLCQACGHYRIDITLAYHWEHGGKYRLSERLLLSMCGKHPNNLEEILCKPSGQPEIEMSLVRLWQEMDQHERAEKLLLNMCNKYPDASEDILCKPSGHDVIDLALVRYWQITKKYQLAEKLLLNASDKHPDASEDILCKPCGRHDIDLALVRTWEMIDKRELAKRLIERCCELYHSKECQFTLLILSCGQPGFMEMISRYPKNENTLLATSIHYFTLACEQIINDNPESGKESLREAFETVVSLLEKHPNSAGGLSQKAHCLRMMGATRQEWKEYFKKAQTLDLKRAHSRKNDFWRRDEASALQKLHCL
ncbi:hypothetical protein [Endozoicomonas sp. 8E]|uniref:hypothetical protein n=1 Tax=Endozoicomonas sp. 8E TaxID=3035692 RepID=UPI002939080C|nr:hypothetical protein [Endozoicomonas sp. 8E]WOG26249.1 hypothetical protein P6910_16985 [Endozoicomonas sp. 8E]